VRRTDSDPVKPVRPRWRTPVRWALIVLAVALAAVFLRGRVPSWSSIVLAWSQARPGWLVVAVITEVASLSLFARQQRWLFGAFGVPVSLMHALAVTYSRSAMSMALPAGSMVSAGFAIEEFHRRGAARATAVTVMVLSGLASLVGLACLYGAGAVVLVGAHVATIHPASAISAVAGIAAAGSGAVWLVRRALRSRPAKAVPSLPEPPSADGTTRWERARRWSRTQREAIAALSVKHWAGAVGLAMANWCADLACLIAVARAFGLHIDIATIAAVYLAVQLVRQIPLSPGGIGFIETSLMAGLLFNGADNTAAAGVVLGYRLISCWLILPIGTATWLWLTRTSGSPAPDTGRLDLTEADIAASN
jgi:uncharacterized membrane protein YbhN (UPF0104 family)